MSFENGGSNPRSNADNRICGVHQGIVNHEFHPDYPQTPPPRYEDVISGRQPDQIGCQQQQGPETHILRQIIFVTPDHDGLRRKAAVGALMMVLFILVISGLFKILAILEICN